MTHHDNPQPPIEQTAQAEQINSAIRFTMYSVFRVAQELPSDRRDVIAETEAFFASLVEQDVVVRGLYDVSGLRADADLMIWWHAETVEALQTAYHGFLRTPLGRHLDPFWSNVGLHRPAEFNRGHVPAFLSGEAPRRYLCIYPFVRSYEWYLLPEDERSTMLRDHGIAAKDFADVRANTVASFALGDYEWLLAFEADELHRIVDLMRALRDTEARRHVWEEIPFFTGPQTSVAQFAAQLR